VTCVRHGTQAAPCEAGDACATSLCGVREAGEPNSRQAGYAALKVVRRMDSPYLHSVARQSCIEVVEVVVLNANCDPAPPPWNGQERAALKASCCAVVLCSWHPIHALIGVLHSVEEHGIAHG
jgi:hypothetical protein